MLGLLQPACERPAPQELPPQPAVMPATTSAPEHGLPPAVGRAPDFEDTAGTVRRQGEQWVVAVPERRPICLPFDAPAEARAEGVAVRFTLYLSPEWQGGCQLVETLVSMRAEPGDRRTTP